MTTDVAAQPAEALLNKRAVAVMLCTSVRTVERLMASGELPAVRLGRRTVRFAHTDVVALIECRRDRQLPPAA